jgi:hypothetical protein
MASQQNPSPAAPSREERIEAIMRQLRPLACELRNEGKECYSASWAARLFGELAALGVDEEQARAMAGQFEFRGDGDEPT